MKSRLYLLLALTLMNLASALGCRPAMNRQITIKASSSSAANEPSVKALELFRLRGASSIGIGSLAGNFFGADEWVDLDDLVRLVAVILVFVSRWQSFE